MAKTTTTAAPEPTIDAQIRELSDRFIEDLEALGKTFAKAYGKKWGQLPTPWKLELPAQAGRAFEAALRSAMKRPANPPIETSAANLALAATAATADPSRLAEIRRAVRDSLTTST